METVPAHHQKGKTADDNCHPHFRSHPLCFSLCPGYQLVLLGAKRQPKPLKVRIRLAASVYWVDCFSMGKQESLGEKVTIPMAWSKRTCLLPNLHKSFYQVYNFSSFWNQSFITSISIMERMLNSYEENNVLQVSVPSQTKSNAEGPRTGRA